GPFRGITQRGPGGHVGFDPARRLELYAGCARTGAGYVLDNAAPAPRTGGRAGTGHSLREDHAGRDDSGRSYARHGLQTRPAQAAGSDSALERVVKHQQQAAARNAAAWVQQGAFLEPLKTPEEEDE